MDERSCKNNFHLIDTVVTKVVATDENSEQLPVVLKIIIWVRLQSVDQPLSLSWDYSGKENATVFGRHASYIDFRTQITAVHGFLIRM